MKFIEHSSGSEKAVEIIFDKVLISSEQDALDLMGNIGYRFNSRKIIINQRNLCDSFFDLKTGIAGGILQKFSNYGVRLAVLGDFSYYKSRSLKDFIYECNKSGQIVFLPDIAAVFTQLM